MHTIPLPIIHAAPIDRARPGVQNLLDQYTNYLNLVLTLDVEVEQRPAQIVSEIPDRLREIADTARMLVDQMASMPNPLPDLSAIHMLIMQQFQTQAAEQLLNYMPGLDDAGMVQSIDSLDHLVAAVSIAYVGVVDGYVNRTGFSLRQSVGEANG